MDTEKTGQCITLLIAIFFFSNCLAKERTIFSYEVKSESIKPQNTPQNKNDSPSIEDEETQEEDGYSYIWRQTKNALYATSVVTGVAVAGAATGGVGALIAIKAGVALSTSTGMIAGGVAGTGYGVGVAIEEFENENPSTTSRVASEIGKAAAITAVAGGLMGVPIYAGPKAAVLALDSSTKIASFALGYATSKFTNTKR